MSSNLDKSKAFLARCPGTTLMQADRYLADASGDVDVAVANFNANLAKANTQRPTAAAASAAAAAANSGNNNNGGGGNNGPRMATLATLNDKKSNEYYVGGGNNSGQAVVAPSTTSGGAANNNNNNNNNNTQRSTKDIFDAARASGAENPEDFDESGATTVPFSGAGRRLGYTEGPSPLIQPVVPKHQKVRISFYKDGFVIDDSNDLRSLTDAAGRAFVESIEKGLVPLELAVKYPNTVIDVKLIDYSNQEFDTPNMHVAFSGAGHKLRATGAASETKIGEATGDLATGGHEVPVPSTFVFNEEEEPKGKVVIHTPDNRRCEHKVNPKRHTVNDLRYLAMQDIPGLLPNRVDLVVRDMPPRKLTDFSLTLAEAKCVNSIIMVRPID